MFNYIMAILLILTLISTLACIKIGFNEVIKGLESIDQKLGEIRDTQRASDI